MQPATPSSAIALLAAPNAGLFVIDRADDSNDGNAAVDDDAPAARAWKGASDMILFALQ